MLKTIGELKRSTLYLYDITIDEQYAYYRVDVMLNSKHHFYQRMVGADVNILFYFEKQMYWLLLVTIKYDGIIHV
jgi:hypothetical protein